MIDMLLALFFSDIVAIPLCDLACRTGPVGRAVARTKDACPFAALFH
jgi:Trk K+ transport system NAD-binding subunit